MGSGPDFSEKGKVAKDEYITFRKKGFQGIHVGILELSPAEVDDIVRCCWAHGLNQQLGETQYLAVLPPILYWHEGFLICTCRSTSTLDKQALTLFFPFVCFSKMPAFQDTIRVPYLRSEVSLSVIKVVPKLLQDIFSDVLKGRVSKDGSKT